MASSIDPRVWEFVQSPRNCCFACGPGNAHGLHLLVEEVNGLARARFVVERWHAGWEDVVHGGILAALLDEVMAYNIYFSGFKGLTARMELRYRAPARHGDELLVESNVVTDRPRVMDIEGRISRHGQTITEATGRFLKIGTLDGDLIP